MQGRSGVGLTAQRDDIERFALQQGLRVESWYQDIQMGGSADALTLRPGLARVLKEAKAARCPMIVSKLDRLSRNVHFISGLMAAAAVLKRAGKKLGVLRWTKRKRLGSRAVKRQKYHLAYRGQMIWNTNCQHGESGARSPLARISPKLSPVLVKELWEKQPDITAPTLLNMLGPKNPLGLDRAMELLTACRTASKFTCSQVVMRRATGGVRRGDLRS